MLKRYTNLRILYYFTLLYSWGGYVGGSLVRHPSYWTPAVADASDARDEAAEDGVSATMVLTHCCTQPWTLSAARRHVVTSPSRDTSKDAIIRINR